MYPNFQQVAYLLMSQEGGGPPPGGCAADGGNPILMIGMMMLILYFVWIRPASRDRKKQANMLEALKRGDEIITNSGIIGNIADMSERIITLEVARNTKIRILRSAIMKKLEEGALDDKPKTEAKS